MPTIINYPMPITQLAVAMLMDSIVAIPIPDYLMTIAPQYHEMVKDKIRAAPFAFNEAEAANLSLDELSAEVQPFIESYQEGQKIEQPADQQGSQAPQ